jgi:C4-dicarboxylate transporter DctM subunit
MTLLFAGALLFLLILAGLPIYVALGGTAVILFLVSGDSIGGVAQVVLDHLDSSSLIAIPYFVLATTFLEHGRAGRVLVELADVWTGWLKGGLGLACVFAALGFSAISGSSTATVIALGTILIPAMTQRGYPKDFAMGVVGASGTLGILIPPSIALIVYGYVTESSIPRLFLAGVIPGLVQVALFSVWVIWFGYRHNLTRDDRPDAQAVLRLHLEALPAIAIPVLILGGIYSGIVTVTEAAALAAVVSMCVGLFVYRDIKFSALLGLLTESITNTARIMLIVAMSFAFSHWIISSQVSQALLSAVVESEISAWKFLLLMNLVMLFLGIFLEVISVILITLPIILPVMLALGIDPIHYAVIVIVNMQIATITPPVGLTLFALSTTTRATMLEIIRGIWPFLLILLLSLVLVTVFPILSLMLPRVALT